MDQCKCPSRGTRSATKDRHLELRTAESIAEMRRLLVAFDLVTPETDHSAGQETPTKSRSFTTYDELMRTEDMARRAARTEESMAELRAVPRLSQVSLEGGFVRNPTFNKRLHTQQSVVDLRQVPDLMERGGSSDYAYNEGKSPTVCNSDYAYYPPVLRNSDYVYGGKTTLTPTNSSYCYLNQDGSSRLALAPRSPANPYARVSSYRQRDTPQPSASNCSIASQPIPSSIFYGEYDRQLPPPVAPNTRTLNKHLRTGVSEADVARLEVSFSYGSECLNKRALTADSLYELGQLTPIFDLGLEVIRDFGLQSLEDLRLLPSLSSYDLHNSRPTAGVTTARSISSSRPVRSSPSNRPTEGVSTARCIRSEDQLHYFPKAHSRR